MTREPDLSERPIIDPAALVAALAELPDAELRALAERLQGLAPAVTVTGIPVVATFVTVSEAARRLSCSPKTVRSAIDRGELKAVRLGRAWRVDVHSIEEAGGGDGGAAPEVRRQPRRPPPTGEFGRRAAGPEAS